jgi:hypothetical protein
MLRALGHPGVGPCIPTLRFNDRRVVEVRELPQAFLSGRLSSHRVLRAVKRFYEGPRWA